jgi:hypothetical protein
MQLEPELTRSTYCRKCSGYIQLGKGRKSNEPPEAEKQPSVFHKLEGLLGVQRTVVAHCFECVGKREVPKSSTSTICPLCGAYIDLQDTGSRQLQPVDPDAWSLIITNKGDLNSNRSFGLRRDSGTMRGNLFAAAKFIFG